MTGAREGSPGAHRSPNQPGGIREAPKGCKALIGPWRMHRGPLGGHSGHWRHREEIKLDLFGKLGKILHRWEAALCGEEGGGKAGGGSIMRVLQCQYRECGLYQRSSGEFKGSVKFGGGERSPSSLWSSPEVGIVIQVIAEWSAQGRGTRTKGQQTDAGAI